MNYLKLYNINKCQNLQYNDHDINSYYSKKTSNSPTIVKVMVGYLIQNSCQKIELPKD